MTSFRIYLVIIFYYVFRWDASEGYLSVELEGLSRALYFLLACSWASSSQSICDELRFTSVFTCGLLRMCSVAGTGDRLKHWRMVREQENGGRAPPVLAI
jgi:hypothetical protein